MEIRILLQDLRKARGLSAAELAKRTGVSRQTIYAIEEGSFVPNTTIALRLARILNVSVEDIFSLDQGSGTDTVQAELLTDSPADMEEGKLVRLCRTKERLIAAPLTVFPTYLPVADGVIHSKSSHRVSVKTAVDLSNSREQLLLAGCDPALSVLTDMLGRSGIEAVGIPCSSRRALAWLKGKRVDVAGSHLLDTSTGKYNVPIVQRLFPEGGVRIVTFAIWEEGLVLGRGNPKSIRGVTDLANKRVIVMNREKGSGSRDLLDKGLRKAGIAAENVTGYQNVTTGHLSAAYAVAAGNADCCVATRSAARCFGLEFIPLAIERFDFSFSEASLELPAVKALLDLLNRSSLRKKLETIAGYDTAHTGEVLI
jgi:putative molybdopterin biosynthesis protein